MSNVDRLQQAGLIQVQHTLTDDETNTINQLSGSEVDALISVRAKLGDDFFTKKVPDGDGHRMGTMLL